MPDPGTIPLIAQTPFMKIKVLFIAALFLLLSACNSETAEPTPTPSPVPTPTATPIPESSCSSITVEPTPAPEAFSVTQDDFIIGPRDAAVTVIQYCDLQSVDCYGVSAIMDKLLENHPEDMRLVVRYIPLLEMQGFENSRLAVQAMIAAKRQGKEAEMYELLQRKYGEWASLTSTSAFEAWLMREAPEIGIDKTQFQATVTGEETEKQATDSYHSAKALGVVPPYPLVLLNGAPVNVGLLYYDYLDQSISLIALGQRQFSECPPFDVDSGKQYIATIHTEKGDMVMRLFADKAPLAVNSFVFLARQGWFDGVTFHRVIPGFVAQAGDPSGTGQGGPGYYFKNESSDLKFDRPGMVGMANAGPDTNGSQFFITYSPQPSLDGGFTVFGQVIQGLDVLENLTPRDPEQGIGLPPGDKILSIVIEEK